MLTGRTRFRLALTAILLISLFYLHHDSSASSVGDEDIALPALVAISTQQETSKLDDFNFTLASPGGEPAPKFSAEDAATAAWATGIPGTPTEARALAAFSAPQLGVTNVLAWVIDYVGACPPNLGPPGNTVGDCLGDRWEVVIGADDGIWLASYSGSALD